MSDFAAQCKARDAAIMADRKRRREHAEAECDRIAREAGVNVAWFFLGLAMTRMPATDPMREFLEEYRRAVWHHTGELADENALDNMCDRFTDLRDSLE